MNLLRKIKSLFIGLLLPATFLLFYNNTTNKHYHVLPDGELIEIAHPFQNRCKDPLHPAETSTKKELIILSQIFYAFSGEIIIFGLQIFIRSVVLPKAHEQKIKFTQYTFFAKKGRSPPVFS